MTAAAAGLWVVAIGCAVMAGVYFTFSAFVMRSLEAMPAARGIAAMQSINRVILSSAFMPLFFATTVLALALAAAGCSSKDDGTAAPAPRAANDAAVPDAAPPADAAGAPTPVPSSGPDIEIPVPILED